MKTFSYRLFIFLGVLALIFMFASPDRQQAVETVDVSPAVQSLLETVVTYHTHQVILELLEDRNMYISTQERTLLSFLADYPGLTWTESVSEQSRVHALYAKDYVALDETTQFKVGTNAQRPFFIQESQRGYEFNGSVVLFIQFETYQMLVDVHYQDVQFSPHAFDRRVIGELFYTVRFVDTADTSVLQAASGSVDFSKEWIRVNDHEYSFAEFNKVALNLGEPAKI